MSLRSVVASPLSSVALFLSLLASRAVAQDPSGQWRTLHSPHFRVHFRPSDRLVAQRAAREAERAWSLLATELVAPHGTVDLTLADNFDIPKSKAMSL